MSTYYPNKVSTKVKLSLCFRVLRRIFGSKRDEVTGGWRKLHNEELHSLYSSMIKSRRMRLAGHVVRMGRTDMHIGHWWEARGKESTNKSKT
jgi:hypothetical protein